MKIILVTLCFLSFLSCKKQSVNHDNSTTIDSTLPPIDSPRKLSFVCIPKKDAQWILHYQDIYDTGFHSYTTIVALGIDTIVKGYNHSKYSVTYHRVDKAENIDNYTYGAYYIRYDSIENKLRYGYRISTSFGFAGHACYDRNYANYINKQVPCYNIPSIVTNGDSIEIEGVKIQTLYMTFYDGSKRFFLADGVGGIGGILDCVDLFTSGGYNGHIRSLSFMYKNDTLDFEYPLIKR